jgi:hypothetical protein
LAGNRLLDADFPVIMPAGNGAAFRIRLDNRERLKDFLGQKKISITNAAKIHDCKIAF